MKVRTINFTKLIAFILLVVSCLFAVQPIFNVGNFVLSEPESPKVWLLEGASIKMSKSDLRLRFYGCVDYEYYNATEDLEVGMVITASDYITNIEDFTYDKITAMGKLCYEIIARDFTNIETASEDGYYEFYCDVTGIVPQNLDRKLASRAFIRTKLNANDEEYEYIYSDYDEMKNARSVYGLVEYWLDHPYEFASSQIRVLEDLYYSVFDWEPSRIIYEDDAVYFHFDSLKRGVLKLNKSINDYGQVTVFVDGKPILPISTVYYNIIRANVGKTFTVKVEKDENGRLPETCDVVFYKEYRI